MSETNSTNVQDQQSVDTAKNAQNKLKKQTVAVKKEQDTQVVSSVVDKLLWLVSIVLIFGAIFGNYYYTNNVVVDETTLGRLGRVFAVIAVIVVGLGVLIFTNKGHALLAFAKAAYVELLKVVWPTRQEAVQTTFIVFIAVCVVSLFLYLCDIVFLQIVRSITL